MFQLQLQLHHLLETDSPSPMTVLLLMMMIPLIARRRRRHLSSLFGAVSLVANEIGTAIAIAAAAAFAASVVEIERS